MTATQNMLEVEEECGDTIAENSTQKVSEENILSHTLSGVAENIFADMSTNDSNAVPEHLFDDFFDHDLAELSENTLADILTHPTVAPKRSLGEMSTLPLTSDEPPNTSPETITHSLDDSTNSENEWSFSDQTLFLALLRVFPYNCCAIATAMLKSCEQVSNFQLLIRF